MGFSLKRVFATKIIHLQTGFSPSGSHNCVNHGHSQQSTGNELSTILWRHKKGFQSHSNSFGGRVEEAHSIVIAKTRFEPLFTGLTRLGQEVMHEVKQALKATKQSISLLERDVISHGRGTWQRFDEGDGFYRPFLPSFGLILGAVSLGCLRSHISLRILAIILEKATWLHWNVVEAEQLRSHTSLNSQSRVPPTSLASFLFSLLEVLSLAGRAIYLILLFSPAVLTAPFADAFGGRYRQYWLHLVHSSLELAGAAFIKWGQWAATRPDLFPRDLCNELTKLHTMAPSHKFSHTRQSVEGAFGRKLDEIFEDFEEEPVASGSIAQVHKATLRFRYPGQQSKPMLVAVKVRHPGVSDAIRQDFAIINWIARLSSLLPGLRWLRLEESVQQFAVFMSAQVDLSREAAHLNRFMYNFRRWKDVSFPKPLYPLVHPAVLVETYEQGESVSRFLENSEKNHINSALVHIGTHTLLKMLLVDNFIHADMHPGNILVRVKRKKTPSGKGFFHSRPHVVYLDVGMTAELSKKDRANLLEFFKAVALRDGRKAAECTLRFSREQSCPNPDAFIKEVEDSFTFWGSEAGDPVRPGECMHDLLEQVRRHKVNIDGDVCTVMVTTLVLEGWQQKLDPGYNIMTTLQTLLFKADWAKSLSYTIDGIMAP